MTRSDLFATYSIVAADADEIGAAVATHQMAVGAIVPWVSAGIGAVVTQSVVNIGLGPLGLSLLEQQISPDRVIASLESSDIEPARRQFAVVNSDGIAASYTGSGCIRFADHRTGSGYSVQANMMQNPTVVDAMAEAFESHTGPLPERMMAVLEAAESQSGDIRGMQSAALVTAPNDPDSRAWERLMDLRVDESADPLEELRRLVRLRRGQLTADHGDQALEAGDTALALERWRQAREIASELEEMAFWQAVKLADASDHHDRDAAALLEIVLHGEQNPDRWLDLVDRLAECGILRSTDLRSRLEAML